MLSIGLGVLLLAVLGSPYRGMLAGIGFAWCGSACIAGHRWMDGWMDGWMDDTFFLLCFLHRGVLWGTTRTWFLCTLRLADPWLGRVACCMICPGPFVPRLQCPTPSPCGLVEVTAVFHLLRFDALAWCSSLPCAGLPACMSVQGACKVSVALGLQTLCSHGVAPVVGRFLHGGLCPSFPVPVSLLV